MLDLTNVRLLQHSAQNLFFGDTFRYAIRDNLKIQSNLFDLTNYSGASGILTALSGFSTSAIDWMPVVLNGSYLGLGRIDSVSYADGIDVKLKPVNIDLTIFNSGNLSNLKTGDPLFSGVSFNNPTFPIYLIENFSEDFSSEAAEDGTYSESQNIKLKFVSGAAIGGNLNPINMAEQFSANLIASNPPVGFVNSFYSGWRQKPGKRTHVESFNLISNEYSVTENFKTLRDISGGYSINYTNSLQLADNGITTVKENGKIQGLIPDNFGNYYAAALSGEQFEVQNNSFNRCNDIFNNYQSLFAYQLNPRRLTYGQTLNKFLDTVSYEVSYSNDPRTNNLFSWEYTQQAERDKNECTYKIIEDGAIQGFSADCNPAAKYSNALVGYSGALTGIYNRSYNFYTGFSMFANPIILVEQSESADRIRGLIKYSQVFTDNLIYSYSGVKKMIVSVNDDFSVPGKNIFDIPGVKQIAQPNNIMTLARRQLSLEMAGLRSTTLSGYMSVAINQINSNIPSGVDPYISALNYSWSPRQHTFSLTNEWTYYNNQINLEQFLLT